MNIYALEGFKVRVTTLNAGCEYDKELAKYYLEVREEYTVDYTKVLSCSTSVRLKEIPNVDFNSVFFEDVEGQNNNDKYHPDWAKYNIL